MIPHLAMYWGGVPVAIPNSYSCWLPLPTWTSSGLCCLCKYVYCCFQSLDWY